MNISGSLMSALAIATLCFSQPESSPGLLSNLFASPSFLRSSFAFLILLFFGVHKYIAGSETFSMELSSCIR
jgi:hypothetical protein